MVKIILFLVGVIAALTLVLGFKDKVGGFFSGGTGGFKLFSFPAFTFNTGGYSSGGNSGGGGGETNVITDAPEGFTAADLSSYYGKVTISASPTSENVSYLQYPSTIRLSASVSEGARIPITGWRIQANRGAVFVPRAVEYFLPPSGGEQYDIVLRSGNHSINIYSSTSAAGRNFRTNGCFGYIARNTNFIPNVSGNCPSVNRSEYTYLSGVCQDYINSVNGSCRNPLEGPNVNYLPDECKEVLRRLTYSRCYEEHQNDANFLSSEWYLWVGQNILDSRHDRVRLYDSNDKLVDEYIY